ncbi:Probable manganese-dependent inorganic pyrophosphatase [Raoultella terrigena]|uniref:Probable manganese-dependent inorganic pyrophosphatase n=1 Tax=Raoultella terrigena TaxID=577 RepID=A0A485BJU5_RAOTE|nr:Probable manganese-dependent inorganic pyrophosphatase [Raoultella terrigena]
MPLSAAQATLLLGAILSDTVALSGPTTTARDREAVAMLREIAGVDYDAFVAGLLAAKTSLAGQSAAQLLHRDAKNYRIHGVALLLAQIEVRDMADISPLLPGLKQEMARARLDMGLEMVVLMLTDITHHHSVLYFTPNSLIPSQQVSLSGMTSRKKEILPWADRAPGRSGCVIAVRNAPPRSGGGVGLCLAAGDVISRGFAGVDLPRAIDIQRRFVHLIPVGHPAQRAANGGHHHKH